MPQYTESTVTIPTAGAQILSAAPKRKAIIFPAPPTNRYTLSAQGVPVLDVGINVYPAGERLILTEADHGQAVQKGWFAASAVAGQIIVIGEVYE